MNSGVSFSGSDSGGSSGSDGSVGRGEGGGAKHEVRQVYHNKRMESKIPVYNDNDGINTALWISQCNDPSSSCCQVW